MIEIDYIKLLDLDKAIESLIDGGLLKTSVKVVSEAKNLAPVDGGQLRNSVMYKLANNNTAGLNDSSGDKAEPITGTPKKGTAFVGSNTEYTIYLEYGTRTQPAQPFLRPAIENVTKSGNFTSDIIKEQNKAFKEAKIRKVTKL